MPLRLVGCHRSKYKSSLPPVRHINAPTFGPNVGGDKQSGGLARLPRTCTHQTSFSVGRLAKHLNRDGPAPPLPSSANQPSLEVEVPSTLPSLRARGGALGSRVFITSLLLPFTPLLLSIPSPALV